jgi:exonuclease III
MAGIATYISIIFLNFNGLNSPIKRHRLVYWCEKKHNSTIFFLQEMNLNEAKVRAWKKIF